MAGGTPPLARVTEGPRPGPPPHERLRGLLLGPLLGVPLSGWDAAPPLPQCIIEPAMQRISVSLSEEVYEALRLRAFRAKMSVDRTARVIIEQGLRGAPPGQSASEGRGHEVEAQAGPRKDIEVRSDFKR